VLGSRLLDCSISTSTSRLYGPTKVNIPRMASKKDLATRELRQM